MTALAVKISASFLDRIRHYATLFFAGVAEGRDMARRYEELSRLSDAALAARGLTREELPQAIASGRIR